MGVNLVTITKREYDYLLDRDFILDCLEAGGVDNWDWYDLSLEPYREAKENE